METLNELCVTINFDNDESVFLSNLQFEKRTLAGSVRLIADCSGAQGIKEFYLDIVADGGLATVSYFIELETTSLRSGYGLAGKKGIVIGLPLSKQAVGILAQHQHKDWWTRPVFAGEVSGIPARTSSLCIRFSDGGYAYFLPLSGGLSKAEISGGSGERINLEINNFAEGISVAGDICLSCGTGSEIYPLIHSVFEAAAKHHPNKPRLKKQREYPHIFNYLGWCSWDAFYAGVNEAGVLDKADELIEKSVPVKWMLIDDGWLNTENERLCSFAEDKIKFPNGFSFLTEVLRNKGIDYVGVWHAMGGYWGGVAEDSELSRELGACLYRNRKNKLLPHNEPERGFGFWDKWYDYLHANGIDFVKVDGQSAVANYCRGEVPIGQAARGAHKALEAAACLWFGNAMINCMGMSSESMWSRISSSVSRNSDDFVPSDISGFTEHLLQNAFNAIFHGQMYYCDWDMFWTKHPDAARHSVLRAVSGGPIYISDMLGETNPELLKPLIYSDGSIIRCDGDGVPAEVCLWSDPRKSGVMKIINYYGECHIMSIYNLTDGDITVEVKLSDINANGQYLVYDYFSQKAYVLEDRKPTLSIGIKPQGVGLVNFIPFVSDFTAIGLTGKYAVAHAVKKCSRFDNYVHISLRESGVLAFYCASEPIKILRENTDITPLLEKKDNLYFLMLEENGSETSLLIRIR